MQSPYTFICSLPDISLSFVPFSPFQALYPRFHTLHVSSYCTRVSWCNLLTARLIGKRRCVCTPSFQLQRFGGNYLFTRLAPLCPQSECFSAVSTAFLHTHTTCLCIIDTCTAYCTKTLHTLTHTCAHLCPGVHANTSTPPLIHTDFTRQTSVSSPLISLYEVSHIFQ